MGSVQQTIFGLRDEHITDGLSEQAVPADPLDLFETWLGEAVSRELPSANALHLATTGPDGRPSGRIVLLRGYDERGLVFYSNYESRKGKELKANNNAAMTFFWDALFRQIRVEGKVHMLPPAESDEYFSSRPRESRIGALASEQSRVLGDRNILEQRINELEEKFSNAEPERPSYWGGYYLVPLYYEFWQGRDHRLHDRIVFRRKDVGANWETTRLYP